ncbi:MAG: aquaporin, partial [Brevefilum sp.]
FPAGLPNIWATSPGSVYQTALGAGERTEAIGEFRVVVACVAELFGTMLLMWGYLAGRERKNNNTRRLASSGVIALTVTTIGLSLGGPSGFAINPARDLGPRLWGALVGTEGLFEGFYWIIPPILIPLFAGPLGAFLYDWLIKNNRQKDSGK